eukprot:CAMPEP_0119119724 /NCGR_PEP_ID=MMETSP1310-20130426/1087_1 /TAXON_ID=464262 /ORGANISM="Genus nov. species nov., Strain RCC2339" /LENGTH=253 /DNA_ID=CAMNT_0007109171 /DNA_START=78 /DNA_END=836 /DNA_ORIENTATION=-
MACCPPGSLPPLLENDYKPCGEVITTEGLQVYEVGANNKNNNVAVVVFYDIFGFASDGETKVRHICDQLAATLQCRVVLPDYYKGDKWPVDAPLDEKLFAWIQTFPWSKVSPEHAKVLRHLKNAGVAKYSAIGFCWGAWGIFHAAAEESPELPMACGVNCHPSVRIEGFFGSNEVALAKKVRAPQILFPAGNDPDNVKEGGEVLKALESAGVAAETHVFPDMVHGFMTRGDINDANTKRDVADCFARAAAYIQ